MKLADIMTKEVVTVSPDESVARAARVMRRKAVGCLVITLNGAVKGIITDRDLLDCIAKGHDPSQCKVSGHMSRPVVVERPDEELLTAAEIMARRRIKRLPVLEQGKLAGIVSFSDISRLMAEQAEGLWSAWVSLIRLMRAEARHERGLEGKAG